MIKENVLHRQTSTSLLQIIPAPQQDPLEEEDFQSSEFYRTIIDNNLFRPLGWRPPRPREPYRLLGTILPKDGNTLPRAILQATIGNTTHTLSLGETLGDLTLVDIQSKQVTLEAYGQRRTLTLNTTPLLK